MNGLHMFRRLGSQNVLSDKLLLRFCTITKYVELPTTIFLNMISSVYLGLKLSEVPGYMSFTALPLVLFLNLANFKMGELAGWVILGVAVSPISKLPMVRNSGLGI